jgi:glycosyltransferase involved in cell wall biosynthesis
MSSQTIQHPAPQMAGLPFEPAQFRVPVPVDDSLADCKGKRIGILIVTYNALSTILPVLKRIPPNVWSNVEEVVVFDDASQDATYELGIGLKTVLDISKLQVIKNPKNLGYGGNQKTGYRYMIEKGFDVVVLLHGDGQYAPEILSHLYAPIVRGDAEAVFGSRMMKDFGGPLKGGMPLYKYAGNRILSTFENRALGLQLTEFHSGYRAYNLHALAELDFSRMTNDFHFDTEIIIKLHHQHFRMVEVPIPTYYGKEICYVNGMRYARDVLRAVRRYRRTVRSIEPAPEFAEYFVRYPIKLTPFSSHSYARQFVGSNQDVLEVGCGNGSFAKELKANGNRVSGVETLPPDAVEPVFERYLQSDLNVGLASLQPQFGSSRFDRILLLDVLEHLQSPERLLRDTLPLLKQNGQVLVSVPNVANLSVRLKLLFGRFDYSERGILDRTHMRFFTRKTARRLAADAGYDVVGEKLSVIPIELILGPAPDSLVIRFLNSCLALVTKLLPGLFSYQILLLLRPAQKQR